MATAPVTQIATQTVPIMLSLFAALSGAIAQYFYKHAALQFKDVPLYRNFQLFAGLIFFTLVLVLFIIAFRKGGRLFVIYPVYATTYIWVGLIGVLIDREPWSWVQVAGVLVIMLGVALVGVGSSA